MKLNQPISRHAPDREFGAPAFSLVEIIVVVALLSVIVLGLLAMFTQTQRAFRTGMTQSDVLESGRLATDLIVRELEQTTPAYQDRGVNFYAELPEIGPFYQTLPGTAGRRTNLVEDLFFVYRQNQQLFGIGYLVRKFDQATGLVTGPKLDANRAGVGTLYRFETSAAGFSGLGASELFHRFTNVAGATSWQANQLPVSKIMDGVIHFKVSAFDTNGFLQTFNLPNNTNFSRSDIHFSTAAPGEIGLYKYYSNAVPVTVELELGILEDRAWQHFKALPTAASQSNYLSGLAGRVHVFRQRVPIRNVDPAAYQ